MSVKFQIKDQINSDMFKCKHDDITPNLDYFKSAKILNACMQNLKKSFPALPHSSLGVMSCPTLPVLD